MLFEGIVLGIIIGFLTKGKLRNFENLTLKLWQLIPLALIIQTVSANLSISDSFFYVLHLLSYGIIMFVCIINISEFSMIPLLLGNLLNGLVIAFNNGAMPVLLPEGFEPVFDRGHQLLVEGTNLSFLADIFYVDVFYYYPRMLSVGDLVLIIGTFILILQGMHKKKME